MSNRTLAGTECKPCSCPLYNSTTSFTIKNGEKKVSRPQVFSEELNRLQAPVIVSYFRQKEFRFQDKNKRGRWRNWKLRKPQYEPKAERCNICQWYKRKRALKSLRNQNKKEQEREARRIREEYERERINDIILWEYGKQQKAEKEEERRRKREKYERERVNDIIRSEYAKREKSITKYEPRLRFAPPEEQKKEFTIKEKKHKRKPWPRLKRKIFVPVRKKKIPAPAVVETKEITIKETKHNKRKRWPQLKRKIAFPAKRKEMKKKKTVINEKSASAKPRARTKQVSVKKYKPRDSLTNRFVNCFYKVCCQFYCCLTCILLFTVIILFIL